MSISSVGNNTNRITGLATGMDTDAMVKSVMISEQAKIDKANQDKQILTWQQEAYIDIIKDLKGLQDGYLDIIAPKDTNMMSSLTYAGSQVTSGNEDILTATALAGAINGTYEVKVEQIATSAKKQSNQLKEGISGSTKLSELALASTPDTNLGIVSSTIEITVQGKVFEVQIDEGKTLNDFMNTIRNSKVKDSIDDKDVLGKYITINYSELTKKLTIETRNLGESATLQIQGSAADALGISTLEEVGEDTIVHIKPSGENDFTTVRKATNNFTIDNVTYNLKKAQAGTDESIKLTVKPDATSAVEKFKKFINKYNELIDKVNTKITEKKNYNYKPLTDEQKASMEKEDIEAWESKAKQGLLKGDMQLRSILDQMRQSFYATVEGAGISITDIGISTSNVYSKGGKLEIDEVKLKSALETRGDQVQKLFTQASDDKNKQGIFPKIKEILKGYIGIDGSLIKKAGYENSRWIASNDLSKGIEKKDKLIKELQTKFYAKQERYYQMYAKLETAMNQLNSQSNWLYSQLGMA